jgi:hypothetical protein
MFTLCLIIYGVGTNLLTSHDFACFYAMYNQILKFDILERKTFQQSIFLIKNPISKFHVIFFTLCLNVNVCTLLNLLFLYSVLFHNIEIFLSISNYILMT